MPNTPPKKDPYDTLATAKRLFANQTPEQYKRMRELQDWMANEKPKIDRRADKNKKQY